MCCFDDLNTSRLFFCHIWIRDRIYCVHVNNRFMFLPENSFILLFIGANIMLSPN